MGAYRAYALKRMMESERRDPDFLKSIQGIPQQPDPKKRGITVPISFKFEPKVVEAEVQPTKEMAEPAARRRVITQMELEKYGSHQGAQDALQNREAKWQREATQKHAGNE